MTSRTRHWYGLIVGFGLISGGAAFAADPQKSSPSEPSPEMRRQMAAVHQKMAACLTSDRPMAECKAEMMKSCHGMMGESGCPMMGSMGGEMKHGHGMMHGGAAEEEPNK